MRPSPAEEGERAAREDARRAREAAAGPIPKMDVKQMDYSAFAGTHVLRVIVSDSSGLGFKDPAQADRIEALVSASPELLEACIAARNYILYRDDLLKQLDAAIAKAEGRS